MTNAQGGSVADLLLTRRGVICLSPVDNPVPPLSDDAVRAVELDLSTLGYLLSWRLHARLAQFTLPELVAFRAWAMAALLHHLGGDQKHEPLFRRFPDDIPSDTVALWWQKVLVHFLQAETQPCLFCRRTGTTHVLNPCRHVVCDHCFDGANYSACPVCEHHVDQSSPFFKPSSVRHLPSETIIFKLLDLSDSAVEEARSLFTSLCQRKQAMPPADREALVVILHEHKADILSWLPSTIPVRENVAVIFGTLFRNCDQPKSSHTPGNT